MKIKHRAKMGIPYIVKQNLNLIAYIYLRTKVMKRYWLIGYRIESSFQYLTINICFNQNLYLPYISSLHLKYK